MTLRLAYASHAEAEPSGASAFAGHDPVFSAFGLYLSTRLDLLPARECLALARIPDHAPPLDGAAAWQLVGRQLGRDPAGVFSTFETVPSESRLLFQSHRARLRTGEPVTVALRHAAEDLDLGREAVWRSGLQQALGREVAQGAALEPAVADFRHHWRRRCDFVGAAADLEAHARESADCDWLRPLRVHRELCTGRVLVVEHVSGTTLEELCSTAEEAAYTAAAATAMDAEHLARQLGRVWLEAALEGRLFPAAPRATEVLLLPDQRFAFTGLHMLRLPEGARTNLSEYLNAVSTQDSDRACGYLLKETERDRRQHREQDLRRRWRQAVPPRDGGSARGELLAEQAAFHCRLMREHDYRLRVDAREFLGGLFLLNAATRPLAPRRDPVLEALEDLRVGSALAAFQTLFGLGQLRENADRYAALFVELPKRLDQALNRAAGGAGIAPSGPAPPACPRRSSAAGGFALGLGLVAAVTVLRWPGGLAAGEWTRELGLLLLVVASAVLLHVVNAGE